MVETLQAVVDFKYSLTRGASTTCPKWKRMKYTKPTKLLLHGASILVVKMERAPGLMCRRPTF